MSDLAPTLQAFFIARLGKQRAASPHTVAAYRDTFRRLLTFCHERTGRTPSELGLTSTPSLSAAFLEHA